MTNWKRWYKVLLLFIIFHVIYLGGQLLAEIPAARGNQSSQALLQMSASFALLLTFFGGYAWYVEHHVKVAPHYSLPVHLKHLLSSIATGLALMIGLNIVFQFLLQLLHIVPETSQNQAGINQMFAQNSLSQMMTLALVVVIAPLCEEVIYRLLLIGPIKTKAVQPTKKHRFRLAILSWVLFILVHMSAQILDLVLHFSTTGLVGVVTSSFSYGILSFVLVREYYLHGSLARSVALHMSWNILAAGVLFIS